VSLFTRGRHRRNGVSQIDGPPLFDGDIPPRSGGGRRGVVSVTSDSALRHSAVWACLRIRADLVSTFPIDVFRQVGKQQVEMPKPPVLVEPGGERWDYCDWMYASQFDMDRAGNDFGLITERNALGLPARIDLQSLADVTVIERKETGRLRYRIRGVEYEPEQVWHERQYVVAGLPFGLSPVAYAAWSIGEYLSAQQFALDWFSGGGIPKARMKNIAKIIPPKEATAIKARFQETIDHGGLLVHGRDWEYDMIQAEQAGTEWLEGRKFGLADISRFFGCPADLIEAAVSAGGTITYQNLTNRNLQFLIMHLGPAIARREKNLNKLLPRPRFVKLNTDALLRMDPETRGKMMDAAIAARRLTVTEARELDNRPPLTTEQEAEFARLFGVPRQAQEQGQERTGAPWHWEQVSPLSAVPYPRSPTFGEVNQ
jgi:HK97 family phage portal protein